MSISTLPTKFVKIKYNDPRFVMTDGVVNYYPAGIEITKDCPENIKRSIVNAMEKGWLIPYITIKQELDYCI